MPDDAIHINKVVKSNAVLGTNQVFQNAQAIEANQVSKNALATKSSAVLESKDVFYAFEIPIKPADTTFLHDHEPREVQHLALAQDDGEREGT